MSEKVETRKTYCTHCQKEVLVAISPAAPRSGHANLPDHDEVVCLDFGDKCDGEVCPLSRFRPVVMGVRLARSGLRDAEGSAKCFSMPSPAPPIVAFNIINSINFWSCDRVVLEVDSGGNNMHHVLG